MKGQDDLEALLETLHDHFKIIKQTSFENLVRNNQENHGAKEIIEISNNELQRLAKDLRLLKLDEEDVRYDIFEMIYEMLFDNIMLRVKQNKLSSRVIAQSTINIDKTVSQYFKENHNTHQKAL